MTGAEQPTPPSQKGPTGPGQNTIYEALEIYINELSHLSFNEEPDDYLKTSLVIENLLEILLNSHNYETHGIIIDRDELTKDAYKKGIKLYNKKKNQLHLQWTLTLITTIALATILYSALS
jgi:hypothetical protein